jgi:PAT family beta-lactamase induction signal transducer AmpG
VNERPGPRVWCFTTYFAEGFPYTIVRIVTSVFYTDIGMKERYLGYLNFLAIPWNLKFLWAPLVDIFGSKRGWMLAFQGAITVVLGAIAAVNLVAPASGASEFQLAFLSLAFVLLAFVSASNDIAIDGYYMEGLRDPGEQAAYTGYRVLAYRVAMIAGRSGIVAVAAWAAARMAGAGPHAPWAVAFGVAALAMGATTAFHAWKLPRFEVARAAAGRTARGTIAEFGRAFASYARQDRFALVLAFIVLYRIGDEILFSMVTPFLMRGLGVTKSQYAWIAGIVGALGAIAGTTIGGLWIKRYGLKRSIWPLTLLMNLNIWAYIWLAWRAPSPATTLGLLTIAFVHGYEQVASGLGNAVLVVYLLRTCKAEFKASHYAIGSAIMSLAATLFGGFGGVIVERIGYLGLFLLGFAASVPSMLLLFWVPIRGDDAKRA